MAEETKRCPFCAEEILVLAKKCKHCGSDLENDQKDKSRHSQIWLWGLGILALTFLFFGNFHVITGKNIGSKIVSRDSFGFNEAFINADAITGMPWIAAKLRYPIGCSVLAREGFIETDDAFKNRIWRETQQKMDKIMRETQMQTEKLLRDLQK